ncbi:glycosyltransferase [Fodinicola feengrottensis]|uniref:glycosyltransferase n=1 Tax=Fodinicola feengrottensis TaxID=435914 RepID=UPI00244122C7|nr:glycosyltransferase [Fodinicola feengrottensis]
MDGDRFSPEHRSQALRRELAPGGELLVGYVGRLAAEKHLELLEPVTLLPGVRVVIVGDGPARKALEHRMPQATFRGELRGADLSAAYASLDLFVHTGANETFCQSVQEALAAGVPAVAPAAGGPLDLVKDGQTGLLVRPDDPARAGHRGECAGRRPDQARPVRRRHPRVGAAPDLVVG